MIDNMKKISEIRIVSLRCTDLGINCPYTIIGKDKNSLFSNIRKHSLRVHGIADLPPDIIKKIDAAIKIT